MSKRSRQASVDSSAESSADEAARSPTKINAITTAESQGPQRVMQCALPPHRQPLDFSSIDAFEIHYLKDHSNRCSSCDRNFPTAHFLSLHIDENHNPLRAELESKGHKTYGCFVEDCDKKCSTPPKRRLHLIAKHAFPKSYDFRVVNHGIDKRTSMLAEPIPRRRRVSTTNAPADSLRQRRTSLHHAVTPTVVQDHEIALGKGQVSSTKTTPQPATSDTLDQLSQRMSALHFVPNSVRRQQSKGTSE